MDLQNQWSRSTKTQMGHASAAAKKTSSDDGVSTMSVLSRQILVLYKNIQYYYWEKMDESASGSLQTQQSLYVPFKNEHVQCAPVLKAVGWVPTHWGTVIPVKKENPMIKRLRDEFKSTYWRFDSPTATIIPGNKRQCNLITCLTLS